MADYKTVIDVTGTELTPYQPELCKGNGKTLDENGELIECCCDECDYLMGCLKATTGEGNKKPE